MRIAYADIIPRVLWGATAGLFGLLLSSLFRVETVPLPLIAALVGLAGLTAWRTAGGLILVALLVPIATWFGRQWNGTVAWPETVVVAFLVGYAARRAFRRRRERSDVLDLALYSTIAVVAASLIVQFLVLRDTVGAEALRGQLWRMLTVDYFNDKGGFESVDAAMRLIEGLLLIQAAAGLARRSSASAAGLARAVVMGAVAASALNLWRVWLGALRLDDPVLAFLRYLGTLRFNTHYSDVNAAGSYYAMALLPAIALARERAWWAAGAIVIGLSLALSGSRAAFAGAIAGAACIAWWNRRRRASHGNHAHGRRQTVIVATLLIIGVGAVVSLLLLRNATPVKTALGIRVEFAATSLRMLKSRPVFGIGIGRYRSQSEVFSSPGLRAIYPHDNAHNNFLQVLAELGVLGFGAFVWVLCVPAVRIALLLSAPRPSLLLAGASAGLLAFVLTWLAGHPLLIDAPAFSFWLLLGAAAGWGVPASVTATGVTTALDGGSAGGRSRPALRWVPTASLIALAVSVPIRARHDVAAANLEHLGIGLSGWQTSDEGTQYRLAGATSTVFVPADAAVVTLPIRSADGELQLELHLDRRYADAVRVSPDNWRVLKVQVPQRRDGRRFLALELRVRNGSGRQPPLLMVGKVQPR